MLLATLVVQLLAAAPFAAPGAVVLVSRRTATSAADAAQKASRIGEILGALKVGLAALPGASAARLTALDEDPARCEGDRNCLASLGRRLQAAVVVTLDVSLVLDEYALRIEAIDTQQGTLLGAHKTSGAWSVIEPRLEAELRPMGYSIATHLRRPSPAALEPAPAAVEAPPPDVVASAPGRPMRRLPVALGLGAAASAVVSGVLLGVGFSHKGTIDQLASDGPPYRLTRGEAEQTVRNANTELTLAIGAAALGVVLGLAALVLGLAGGESP